MKVGDKVKFYDCDQADQHRDYSGTNPKYYPIGEIIRIYEYKSKLGYTDMVCDIKIAERISKSHFLRCVEIV